MMPFDKVSAFVNSFPQVEDLTRKQQEKALEIFNSMMEDGVDEGEAIATAISRVKEENMEEDIDRVPPKTAQENAQKVIRWREEHPDEIKGMTRTGWTRANQLADGEELSKDVIKRMAQFNRHRENSSVAEEHKGKPWMDAGHVAWLGWGGDIGVNWAIKQSKKITKENKSMKNETKLAEPQDLSEGDLVRWSSSGGTAYGKITNVSTDGTLSAEPEGPEMEGTEDKPAFKITVHDFDNEDEEWKPTDTKVVHRAKTLTLIDSLPEEAQELREDYRYLNKLSESEDGVSKVEVLRSTTLQDREMEITDEMLEKMEQNFQKGVYGIKDKEGNPQVAVNANHGDGEALGWVKDLQKEEDKLMATIEWTELGEEKLEKDLFKFVSAEFKKKFPHPESGEMMENVFTGLALTNKPALKGQTPVELSEQINLQDNNNLMFQSVLDDMMGRDMIKQKDLDLLEKLFNRLDDEQKSKFKQDVEKVKSKVEGEDEDEDTEDDEDMTSDKEEEMGKDDEELSELSEVELRERLKSEQEEKQELREELKERKLNEKFESELMLSEEDNVGFEKDKQDEVVEFMSQLTQEKRDKFVELLSEVSSVDTETHGSTKTINLEGSKEEKLSELINIKLEEKGIEPDEAGVKEFKKTRKEAQKELS